MKKIFFSASTYCISKYFDDYMKIIDEVEKNGAKIVSDWTKEWKEIALKSKGKKLSKKDISKNFNRNKLFEDHIKAINKCDALIAEVSNPSVAVGYQIYYAISNKKPILAIYSADCKEIDISNMRTIVNIDSPLVTLKMYTPQSLSSTISYFIKKKMDKLIKFNFIINQEIDDYIKWLEQKYHSKSKSEILRQKINDEIIIYDNEYQHYLKSLKS